MLPLSTQDQVHLLVVAGLRSWSDDPWQAWLDARFRDARWIRPVDGEWPDPAVWAGRIAGALEDAPPEGSLVIAHGFGALGVVWHALHRNAALAGAILLAPADPKRFAIDAEAINRPLPFPTSLVSPGTEELEGPPWLGGDAARRWARLWGARFVDAGAGPAPDEPTSWMLGQRVLEQHVQRFGQRHRPAAMQTPWAAMSV
jgi:uncharacterized protein